MAERGNIYNISCSLTCKVVQMTPAVRDKRKYPLHHPWPATTAAASHAALLELPRMTMLAQRSNRLLSETMCCKAVGSGIPASPFTNYERSASSKDLKSPAWLRGSQLRGAGCSSGGRGGCWERGGGAGERRERASSKSIEEPLAFSTSARACKTAGELQI